jgi:hypothetical protein
MPAFAQPEPTGLKERLDAIVRAQQTARKRFAIRSLFGATSTTTSILSCLSLEDGPLQAAPGRRLSRPGGS